MVKYKRKFEENLDDLLEPFVHRYFEIEIFLVNFDIILTSKLMGHWAY